MFDSQIEEESPPETIVVKMRGRPAGSKNKAKAENPIIEAPQQPDPMYTALMKRLDAMDGMLAKRETEIEKKEKAPPRPRKAPSRVERDISPELVANEQFRIQGSPWTASRQLMAHLQSQQMERASAREVCIRTSSPYENDSR